MPPPSYPRPRFSPSPFIGDASPNPAALCSSSNQLFSPIVSCPAPFPAECFEPAISQLIDHPEYNSTLILRSDTLSTITDPSSFPCGIPLFLNASLYPMRVIHRKLLPRRPGRDPALEQYCTFYAYGTEGYIKGDEEVVLVVLSPLLKQREEMPYYHPKVEHLAFRYIPPASSSPDMEASLRIEALPTDHTSPLDSSRSSSRLFRLAHSLLDTLHRNLWGHHAAYTKRVHHDNLVGREAYQDLYLKMRERHGRELVEGWKEVTDPSKHVYEDIGIATYLMLLWKDMYASSSSDADSIDHSKPKSNAKTDDHVTDESKDNQLKRAWDAWPRPPGGFLDIGCGNALLTHILTAEGYAGYGIDVRARASWSAYPETTRERLVVGGVDPTSDALFTNTLPFFCPPSSISATSTKSLSTAPPIRRNTDQTYNANWDRTFPFSCIEATSVNSSEVEELSCIEGNCLPSNTLLPPGAFIIANHADELTPWTPILATLFSSSGYLSIPCCAWALEGRWGRGLRIEDFDEAASVPAILSPTLPDNSNCTGKDHPEILQRQLSLADINLGVDGTNGSPTSTYAQYRLWLARLSLFCGWVVETEMLRIPSTRNWAVIGRTNLSARHSEYYKRVETMLRGVRERSGFVLRRPEGKAGWDVGH